VNPGVERAIDDRVRFFRPGLAAKHHAAQVEYADLDAGAAKLAMFHGGCSSPHRMNSMLAWQTCSSTLLAFPLLNAFSLRQHGTCHFSWVSVFALCERKNRNTKEDKIPLCRRSDGRLRES